MITREEALKFLSGKIENKNIIKHMIAAEALMRALAAKLKAQNLNVKSEEKINEDEWAMVGLLHDGDYCEGVLPEKQGIQVVEWLREGGFEVPEAAAHAMAAHNWHNTGVEPQSLMDWALFCGDSLTGLIVAAALVLPSRKLADVNTDMILRRFKELKFAAGTRREEIALCEEKFGLPLAEFVEISLKAMQDISGDLGL
ncbi:MAG: phosphohydrolase [bacterium]|nr:phosphohydrolase [bacterium]